jgi:iron complex outermembrane receptor protein
MLKTNMITVIFALILLNTAPLFPQSDLSSEIKDPELEQEFKWLKAETYVITASKVKEDIKKSAASISVVTDKQIRQMGAKDLMDVLRRAAPSMGTPYYYSGVSCIAARGIVGSTTNNVLLMINSHPVNSIGTGGATWVYDTLIVDNIKRIEVIRGPGSALYGANAFHGVINVITKEAEDIDGFELIARGGSYDTQQYNLLYGKTFSDLEVAFNFNYFKTHGFRGLIEGDSQTAQDQFWGAFGFAPASLAPGRMAGDREKYDAALTLKYKGFKFDGKYVDKEWDMPVGWQAALNHESIASPKDYYLTLSYETNIWEGLNLYGKVYRNLYDASHDMQFYPPGHVLVTPAVPTAMPNGQILRSSAKARRIGIEIQTTYRTSDSNTVIAGATYEDQKQYDNSTAANFIPVPGGLMPLPSVQKWPDIFTQNTEKRNFKAVFFEDIWDLTDDVRLTLGARYDHYSDFGSEFSPRAGLTWEYIKGYDLKLLYGHAFRAPSFYELYSRPSGNPDLAPEKNDTYEISLGAEFTYNLNARLTLYHREGEDLISMNSWVPPWNYVNRGKFRDQGFELEMKYDFGRGTYLAGNYQYASWKTEYAAPRHMGNFMANIRLSRYLNLYTDCNFFDGMSRTAPGDTRDDPSGGGVVNTTLIAKKFLKGYEGLELRGSIYNMLDKDLPMFTGPEIPNDIPMPRRNYLFEIKYEF